MSIDSNVGYGPALDPAKFRLKFQFSKLNFKLKPAAFFSLPPSNSLPQTVVPSGVRLMAVDYINLEVWQHVSGSNCTHHVLHD